MHRVRFIEHRGRRVLLLDYTHLTNEQETLEMVERRKRLVAAQPPDSLLTLTDVTGARFGKKALDAVKGAAVLDLPHVHRAAIVGVETLGKGVLEAVATFSLRSWQQFSSRAQALDWLVSSDEATASQGTAKAG